MSASRAAKKPDRDQQVLVLLAVGLLIGLGPQLFRSVFPPRGKHSPAPAAYLWLNGTPVEEGLYRIPPDQREKASRSISAELPTIRQPVPTAAAPAAFRLQANGLPPAPIRSPAGLAPLFFAPIAINRANRELLMTLPGIGPRLADAIIGLRRQKKGFHEVRELLEVYGIGKGKLARLEGLVTID